MQCKTLTLLLLTIGSSQAQLGQYGVDQAVYSVVGGDDPLSALQGSIPGTPGEDYPINAEVPETGFSCDGQVDGGYYADPSDPALCQVFHICTADGQGGLAKYSFLCPNGTIFNQNYFICDWWFNFDCSEAEGLYSLNDDIAAERAAAGGGSQAVYGSPSNAAASYASPPAAAAAAAAASPSAGAAYSAPSSNADSSYAAPVASPPLDAYAAAQRAARRLNNGRR